MNLLTATSLVDEATSAVTSGLQETATSAGGILVVIVGIVISIFAAVYVVRFGMALFRKLKPS